MSAPENPHSTPEKYLGRAIEKTFSKIWWGFLEKADWGLYPKEYNRKVHGNYLPWRYYGKPDTPFMELKLNEIVPWIARRSKSPRALIAAVSRFRYRYVSRWVWVRYMNLAFFFQFVFVYSSVSYWCRYRAGLKYQKQYRYHW